MAAPPSRESRLLRDFAAALGEGRPIEFLRDDLVGAGAEIPGPTGAMRMLYADYAASGRALRCVENFIQAEILPFYANAHTEASYCGAFVNGVRAEARAVIGQLCGADDDCSVIFCGAGATAGLNRVVALLGAAPDSAAERETPIVLIGPYEHHSNLLPWRESGAEVVEMPESVSGGPDLDALSNALEAAGARRVIGAFSAVSNVTGIVTDVEAVTGLLKRYDATVIWDYAGGAPYVPMDMRAGGGVDAIAFSPHKFIGGPGASGVLVVRNAAMRNGARPSAPGGGTVSFVSPWAHHYVRDLIAREEAGTPNLLGDIRAALALLIKARIGDAWISQREDFLVHNAIAKWSCNPSLELLGSLTVKRVPIFSFRVRDGKGGYVHHQLVTRMLSDYFGVQARGGCACAGPYAHRLLDIDRDASEALWSRVAAGDELDKPGWVRVNFSYLADIDEVERLIASVNAVAGRASELAQEYECDATTARFRHRARF
ncbi:MAG TPA: aminotransferase class V-fold PLP-dependent enzyme [Vitreimonas sp.]|nr:aminotransferase class V-fold PLP-dependent enzyme [Vitreimonas sp.]